MAILSCHVSIKLPPKISDGQRSSPGHPADRAQGGEGGGGGGGRRGSGGRAGLLRRSARRLDRRWAAAAGGRRAEVARSAEPDRRQLGPGGVPGGRLARGFESAAAVAAARAGGDGRPVAGGAGGLQMGQ